MVKKFYMETKNGTLEQSVLDVWQNAAEQTDTKMDGRTKGYRNHRSKLEARKAKREEKRASTKLDEDKWKELPGKVVAKRMMSVKSMKPYAAQIAKMKTVSTIDLERELPHDKVSVKDIDKVMKETWEIGTDEYRKYLERHTPGEIVIEEPVDPKDREELDTTPGETANKMKKAKHPSAQVSEGTKEEYEKFFNAAMKKFKIDSPSDLKSDEEKKKFFDYIDKNYKGEKDEELTKLAKDFKVSSMREVLTKMWTVNEGELPPALKKAIDAKKDKEKKEDKDNGKKTLTGKKKAEVEVNPDLIAARKY